MLIDRILKKNNFRLDELDLIVVSDNPGSQTGLRTGMAAVKGLADSLEIKFIRFSVLESLAVISGFNGSINVILDSEKNNNVYFQTITVFPNLKIQKTEIERLSIDTVKNKLINSGENFVISASLRWHFKDLKFDNATSKILFTDTDIPAKILGKHYLSLKSDFCESD